MTLHDPLPAPRTAREGDSEGDTNPVRRVIIVYDFGFINGGAAQVAIQSAIGLAERGVAVDYFCAVGPPDPRLADSGVTITCLQHNEFQADPNLARALVEGVWKESAAKALEALLSTVDPEGAIIHVHGWTKALSASVLAVAERSAIPVVVTLHEYFSACPNGGFYNHRRRAACGRVAMSASCIATHCDTRSYGHKLWRVMRQAVAAHAAGVPNRMHDVIYISEFSRDILTPYFRPQTRWRKVSNGINVTRSPRVPAERNGAFLFVGRLSPEKGAIVFAKAAAVAQAPARIVGDGSESQEIARAYPQAELLGWLPAEGVFAEMERARALVFPSLWYETQGLSVYEALARGVPVIVADGAAARDAVVDGENGLLFRTGDAHDLAAKIAQLADPALVKRMSEAAYARYWSRPTTPETHLEELFAAYGDILRERGAAQTR